MQVIGMNQGFGCLTVLAPRVPWTTLWLGQAIETARNVLLRAGISLSPKQVVLVNNTPILSAELATSLVKPGSYVVVTDSVGHLDEKEHYLLQNPGLNETDFYAAYSAPEDSEAAEPTDPDDWD